MLVGSQLDRSPLADVFKGDARPKSRSYRTLRDGSLWGRFSRHFVPGYFHSPLRDQTEIQRPSARGPQSTTCPLETANRKRSTSPIEPAFPVTVAKINSEADDQPNSESDPRGWRQEDHLGEAKDDACNWQKGDEGGFE